MQITWQVSEDDVKFIQAFYEQHKNNNSVVTDRMRRNVNRENMAFSKETFWKSLVTCLLTTQQRSGPNSAIVRFLQQSPFPLSYELCRTHSSLEKYAGDELKKFGGIRRSGMIANEIATNLSWLESKGWKEIENIWEDLIEDDTPEKERSASSIIIKNLKGFGPKQARNLLQMMGLTKYEIPIDSRIMKWMKEFGFPLELSAKGMADEEYFNFILDGFKEMCKAADIYPCLMDAAIFTSFDGKDAYAEND